MSISPNVPSPQESYHYESSTGTPRWIAVLFGVLFVALAAMGFSATPRRRGYQNSFPTRRNRTSRWRRNWRRRTPAWPI